MTCRLRLLLACLLGIATISPPAFGQSDELRMVIVVSRHGVRAPIESETRSNRYNTQPWPTWPVAPGVLTPNGATLMGNMGSFYRQRYANLFHGQQNCSTSIFAAANRTERTISSAQALLKGLAPSCPIKVNVHDTSGLDPLFEAGAFAGVANHEELAAAIRGRLGGDPQWWPSAYQHQLEDLQQILLNCKPDRPCNVPSTTKKLLDDTSIVKAANISDMVQIDGPVSKGADFAENFLLQYTEGLPMSQVGWGRVSRPELNTLMTMNTGYHDYVLRTPYFAQIGASNLASHIAATLQQAADEKSVGGAIGAPGTRFLLLLGHDSNLTWLSGLLHLNWLLPDQPLNATPPGSALVFELHHNPKTNKFYLQVYFMSQTLDQMRYKTPLTTGHAPSIATIFVPNCSTDATNSCPLDRFQSLVQTAIDRLFVEPVSRKGNLNP
ncbi:MULTISPECIES: histidine-type phosphatase [Acidobacteriaceae]|uniref:histidine-type phosphatase n=1 Tax=Acidobacteriaceae TaxID=204434 RepID=UPI00131CA0E5|nr:MULTISPECIES: histidine-type phosphatase [Acidobacteriaceae]MDW5264632.1 histidine-type phosphatase [Edaphobacter sp.]